MQKFHGINATISDWGFCPTSYHLVENLMLHATVPSPLLIKPLASPNESTVLIVSWMLTIRMNSDSARNVNKLMKVDVDRCLRKNPIA